MHSFLFTFENTHQALKGEKYLKGLNQKAKLIPTPFEIFSECGFSLELEWSETQLEDFTKDEHWKYVDCYLIIKTDGRNTGYEKI